MAEAPSNLPATGKAGLKNCTQELTIIGLLQQRLWH